MADLPMCTEVYRAGALDDLRAFPVPARREAGHQLDRLQRGLEPDNWKPISSAGQGVQEIRVWDPGGTFRVICVAKYAQAIFDLHCFQKKTSKTSKADIDLAAKRYRDLLKELSS